MKWVLFIGWIVFGSIVGGFLEFIDAPVIVIGCYGALMFYLYCKIEEHF